MGTEIPIQNILLKAASRSDYFPNPATGFSEGSEITQGSSILNRTFHSNGNIYICTVTYTRHWPYVDTEQLKGS